MTGEELTRRFAAAPRVVDEADFPRDEQLRMLSALASVYEDERLIQDGDTPPLWECCPMAGDCWRGAHAHRPTRRRGRSGITLPWVGPDYRVGGVAVVAINLRDAGGLLEEYAITCETAGDPSQLNRLSAGCRTAHRSRLAYGSTRSAAAVLDWLEARPIVDRERPQDLTAILKRIVRLQAVKCSPDDNARSSPTPAMGQNCPRLLLERELAVLRPAALVTVGDAPWRAVYNLPGYLEAGGGSERFSFGTLRVGSSRLWVFSLDHPVSGDRWDRGHRDMVRTLRELPRPRA